MPLVCSPDVVISIFVDQGSDEPVSKRVRGAGLV
jgi:hypothetical protein